MFCLAVRLMAVLTWCVVVAAAHWSFIATAAVASPQFSAAASPSNATGLHLPPEERPLLATSATNDLEADRSEVSTNSNRTTTTAAVGNVSATTTTAAASGNSSATAKDIWLIGLFPLRGSWAGGLGQLPAVQMGIEDVNANPNILPGYTLRMTMDDTEVSRDNM